MVFSKKLTPFLLALGIGCAKDTGTTPDPVPTPEAAGFAIAGAVTSKANGGPIEGSVVTFRGIDGPGAGSSPTALINNGSYFIDRIQSGTYEVKITGGNQVEHTTERVTVGPGKTNIPFSLFVYGDQMFGIPYDERFHRFFNFAQRIDEYYKKDYIKKWDDNAPPKEIYVVKDTMSEEAFRRVIRYVENFVGNISKLACSDSLDNIPINYGPETTSTGKIVVRLKDVGVGNLASAGLYMRDDSTINGCDINLGSYHYENQTYGKEDEQMAVDHEGSHCLGMNHAYQTDVPSIMNNSTTVTDYDRFARCLSARTQSGNKFPDNDRFHEFAASRPSYSYSEVCKLSGEIVTTFK